jgi:two-component system chemotaxis sensor kinase CheA
MNEMFNEYKDLFLEEADEYITAFNDNLIAIEKNHDDAKLIDNIFRVAHTLKSSCAAVGLKEISALAHKAEDVMHKVRDGHLSITEHLIDVLFEVLDTVRSCVDTIKEGKEPSYETSLVTNKLEEILQDKQEKKKDEPVEQEKDFSKIILTAEQESASEKAVSTGMSIFQIDIEIDPREMLKWLRAELLLNKARTLGEIIAIHPAKEKFTDPSFSGSFSFALASRTDAEKLKPELMVDLIKHVHVTMLAGGTVQAEPAGQPVPQIKEENKTVKEDAPASVPLHEEKHQPQKQEEKKDDAQKIKTSDTIRVNTEKLDDLMNQIGELATTISGIRQIEKRIQEVTNDAELVNQVSFLADKLSNLSMDLQYSIMSTRMLPVSTVFNQFNRVVRDLAHKMRKKVELRLKNEETELDKKIIDSIGEPLMHLVRNSVDHGIESPEKRKAQGKPETGTITLSAERTGNHIMISIMDDGAGCDVGKIRKTILKRKLASEAEVESMSDEQALQYIFEPGFSTQEKVSDVSGRGVGLDVVKTVVNGLGGSVEIRSEPGMGTEFVLLLPLTLTTTFVILFCSGKNLYAIPVNDVKESLSVETSQIRTVDQTRTIILRDEVLPLISLKETYGNEKEDQSKERASVIVVSYRDKKIGIIVDKIIGTDEIVLKSLEKNYQNIEGLSGASILGDGRIALGLDVLGILNMMKRKDEQQAMKKNAAQRRTDKGKENQQEEAGIGNRQTHWDPGKNMNPQAGNALMAGLFERSFVAAAASLSNMTGRVLTIASDSEVKLIPGEDIINCMTGEIDKPYFGSIVKTHEGLTSNILFVTPKDEGIGLFDLISGNPEGTTTDVTEDAVMAIGEINNVLSSSFINNVANHIGKEIHPGTPLNSYDMLGAILQGAVLQEEMLNKQILCAETVIAEKDKGKFKARIMIMTDKTEFEKLL